MEHPDSSPTAVAQGDARVRRRTEADGPEQLNILGARDSLKSWKEQDMGDNVLVEGNPRLGWFGDGDPETPEMAVMLQNTGEQIVGLPH